MESQRARAIRFSNTVAIKLRGLLKRLRLTHSGALTPLRHLEIFEFESMVGRALGEAALTVGLLGGWLLWLVVSEGNLLGVRCSLHGILARLQTNRIIIFR